MNSVKNLIAVLMDGITDAKMLLDYADAAEEERLAMWFRTHAKRRISEVHQDREDVFDELDIEAKAKGGDKIAGAMKCHIDMQIKMLDDRI